MAPFIRDMIPLFAGEQPIGANPGKALSDPPQEEPSEMPGQPLHWLATPSVGTMLGLALLGVGVVAANRGRRKQRAKGGESEQFDAGSE